MGDTLFFRATNGTNNYELWKSDGTDAGTVMVKDIAQGGGASSPQEMTVLGDHVYFRAHTSTAGYELWKSDGTDAGTVMVKDINTSAAPPITAGVALQTIEVVAPAPVQTAGSTPQHLTAVGNTLYFTAINDSNQNRELWKSDGTEAGTVLVKDIRPGSFRSDAINLTNISGKLVFQANDGSGLSLWQSDGSDAGTVKVDSNVTSLKSLAIDQYSDAHRPLITSGGYALIKWDGKLYKTNGTESGTVLVKDINPGGSAFPSAY